MSDDDRTVDADDAALDELRRLAADVRNQQFPPPPADPDAPDAHGAAGVDAGADRDDDDVTVGADDASLDELRRFAAEARAQQSARRSDAPSDATSSEALGSTAPTAPSEPSAAGPPPPLPEVRVPDALLAATNGSPNTTESRSTTALADLPVPDPLDRQAGPDPDRGRDHDDGDVTRSRVGDGWRPPPRTVMPTEPERHHEVEHGPWRKIAIGLAVALVVVTAAFVVWIFVIDGGGADGPAPTEPTAPTLDGDPEPTDVGGGSGGN